MPYNALFQGIYQLSYCYKEVLFSTLINIIPVHHSTK